MERDSGSRFHQQRMLSPSPNLNLLGFPLGIRRLDIEPVSKNLRFTEDPALQVGPFGMQEMKTCKSNHSCSPSSFYGQPHFLLAVAPLLNSASTGKFPAGIAYFNEMEGPALGTAPAQKKFLVFDQSGGKTTLNYFSGAQTPVQCGTCCVQRPPTAAYNSIKEELPFRLYPLQPNKNDEQFQNDSQYETGEDEIREDTEELNALLYSDSDFPGEDEETSTGHSPSTMTDDGTHDFVEEIGEEIDSSTSRAKRQKLLDGCYDETPQMHTGGSLKTYAYAALEDEAESTPGNDNKHTTGGLSCALSGTKRKERLRETVKFLQSIFPAVNSKDAVDVIDEAIYCLRSLKVKATALGLDTL